MNILKAQIREASSKGNQLRREGIIPAILFGKHLDESISIQIPKGDVVQFLHNNPIGSKVDLAVGKKKYMALFKSVDYIPAVNLIQHLSFQVMTAGEKVTSEFHIHLHNRAKVEGIVQQHLSQVHYKALPDKLFDTVDVELEGKVVGDSAVLADLDFAKNPDIEIITPLDSPVYSIAPRKVVVEEAPVLAVSAEVPAFENKEET
ncbi:MAG: 50S ribosomal protein L25 [Eubacteriales bacterium]